MNLPGFLAAALILSPVAHAGKYVLTFDDAPTCDTLLTGVERTQRLIDTLETCAEGSSVFYCNTKSLSQKSHADRLQAYAEAGHILANHTHDHPHLSHVSAKDFIQAVDKANQILSTFPNYKKWFRFPYLDESYDDLAKHDQVKQHLRKNGYSLGYITVDIFDFYVNDRVQKAHALGKKIDFDALRKLYVRIVVESVQFYDALAKAALGRSPVHILLLHERDLNAWFLKDVIQALEKRGFQSVTAEDGFLDPIAHWRWNDSPDSMSRVSQIAGYKGIRGPRRPQWTQTGYIDQMFEKYKVIQ